MRDLGDVIILEEVSVGIGFENKSFAYFKFTLCFVLEVQYVCKPPVCLVTMPDACCYAVPCHYGLKRSGTNNPHKLSFYNFP